MEICWSHPEVWPANLSIRSAHFLGTSIIPWDQYISLGPVYFFGTSIFPWDQYISMGPAYYNRTVLSFRNVVQPHRPAQIYMPTPYSILAHDNPRYESSPIIRHFWPRCVIECGNSGGKTSLRQYSVGKPVENTRNLYTFAWKLNKRRNKKDTGGACEWEIC